MKKGQIFEGTIERVRFPNKGIIKIEDREVIAKNGLPGQKVRFSVNKVKKGKCEGRILEVLRRSSAEIPADCPHFGECGGCVYRNLPYEEQRKLKERQLRELLDAVCGDYEFLGVKPSPALTGYRNKMEFSFGDGYKGGPLALGMHKRDSFYDIVTVDSCRIADDDFGKILTCTLGFFREKGMDFYHKMSREGYLRHLLVRKGAKSGDILIDLVTTTQDNFSEAAWADRLFSLPLSGEIVGILHTFNNSAADAVKDEGTKVVYGRDHLYEEILGLTFKITPFSFFQTNSLGAEVLYETAREFLGDAKDRRIFDLYSGTGTIAQILAPAASKVVGVEIVPEAVEAARENAKRNGLANCEFIAGDVLKVLDELCDRPDLIVLDPPREGVHPKALRKIISYHVDRIVYISCNPISLVRDLKVFCEAGYEVEKAAGVDLFVGTAHMETVCLLSNRKPDTKVKN